MAEVQPSIERSGASARRKQTAGVEPASRREGRPSLEVVRLAREEHERAMARLRADIGKLKDVCAAMEEMVPELTQWTQLFAARQRLPWLGEAKEKSRLDGEMSRIRDELELVKLDHEEAQRFLRMVEDQQSYLAQAERRMVLADVVLRELQQAEALAQAREETIRAKGAQAYH